MTTLKRTITNEGDDFLKKFPMKKHSYILLTDATGQIKSCETEDKDIITWLKSKGLT